jgi:hypothetical protein
MPAHPNAAAIKKCLDDYLKEETALYGRYLYNQSPKSTLNVSAVDAVYDVNSKIVNGYEVLNHYFDQLFESNPFVYAFGEDLGNIGDVNQGFAGLQAKHGADRIFD